MKRIPTSPYALALLGIVFAAAGIFVFVITATGSTANARDRNTFLAISAAFAFSGFQLIALAFFKRVAKIVDAVLFFPLIIGLIWAVFTPSIHFSHPYIIRSEVIVFVVFLLVDAGRKLLKNRRGQDTWRIQL